MASSGSKLTGTRMLSTYSGSGKKNWNCDWAFPVPYLHEFVFIHIFARIFFYLVKSSGQRYIYSRTIPDNAWSLLRKETNIPNTKYGQATYDAQLLPDNKKVMLEFFQTRNPSGPDFFQPNKPIYKNISSQWNSYFICSLNEETYMPTFFRTN